MSFYLTLSSELGTGQPGDFQSELHNDFDFRDGWEVALADMTYTGQGFKNVPTENANITVTSRHKNFYDDDYCITWDQAREWSIALNHYRVKVDFNGTTTKDRFEIEYVRLPQQHCSWP